MSVRNPDSGSKYDYKMYAIVHRQAETCSKALGTAAFEVVVVDPPVLEKKSGEIIYENTFTDNFVVGLTNSSNFTRTTKYPRKCLSTLTSILHS
jgi:hypothetical protein